MTLFVPVVQASVQASAQASEQIYRLPSMISFSTGGDAEGSRDHYLDLDYAFVNDTRLLFSFSNNRSDSQDISITTRSVLLGFRTDPLQRFSGGMDLENWGEKGSLETDTLRVVLDVSLQNWQLSLRPQWRNLTFTTDCVRIVSSRCKSEVEVKSTGVAFDVSYYTDGPWSFSLGFSHHDYDKNVEALAVNSRLQLVFSAATLDLSTGLEESRGSAGVFYFRGSSLWGLSSLKSLSAVTGETSFVNTLSYSTDLTEQWRLRLRMGVQTLKYDSDRTEFSGAGLTYSW